MICCDVLSCKSPPILPHSAQHSGRLLLLHACIVLAWQVQNDKNLQLQCNSLRGLLFFYAGKTDALAIYKENEAKKKNLYVETRRRMQSLHKTSTSIPTPNTEPITTIDIFCIVRKRRSFATNLAKP